MPCTNLNETKLTMLTSFAVDFDFFVKKYKKLHFIAKGIISGFMLINFQIIGL